jgi:hypothetical protein
MATPPICVLTGTLFHSDGIPAANTSVRLQTIQAGNNAIFIGSSGISKMPLSTFTDENGVFFLNVLQGLQAILSIEDLDYEKQVTIPAQAAVDIKDL